jgi:hypothetical protein
MSIRLAQAAATVAGTEVTVNVSDILGTAALQNGWFLVKFADVLLVAATPYTVSAKTSGVGQVNLYRDAAAGNWSRLVRSTTTGAPGAGDNCFVLGEWTAAATKTDRTVTMDSTATTDYGTPAAAGLATFGISNGGTVTWGTTAATNYRLRQSGNVFIWAGGVMNMGTVATPCPRGGTQELQFDCAADGDFGLIVWGTFNFQGLSRLAGVDRTSVLLTADAAGGATSLTVDAQLSAVNTDSVAIGSTTRTPTEGEDKALTLDAGATTLTIAAIANAHGGNAATFVQGECVVLTRSVRVLAVTAGQTAYVVCREGSTIDADWGEFRYLGHTTAGKQGVEIDALSTGSFNINACSFRDFDQYGFTFSGTAPFTFTNNVLYRCPIAANNATVTVGAGITSLWTMTGNVIISPLANGSGFSINDLSGNFSNNRCSGSYQGGQFGEAGELASGTFADNVFHSASNYGVLFTGGVIGGTFLRWKVWRSGGAGAATLFFASTCNDSVFEDCYFFGGANAGVYFTAGLTFDNLTFRNCVLAGETGYTTTYGFMLVGTTYTRLRCEGCTFGVASGLRIAHTTADFRANATYIYGDLTLVNCTLASTEWSQSDRFRGRASINYQRHEGVASTHSSVMQIGTVALDAALYRTTTPSEKMTPVAAPTNLRLQSAPRRFAVTNGQTLTIAVYTYKSPAYNGSAVRLVVKCNSSAGVSTDQVLDSMVGAASTWEQLTGSVGPVTEDCIITAIVECDGAAGQVNTDDWSASVA